MNLNSRRQPRIVPQAFTFLQLEGDEGGRVVNISEAGICFESFASIRQTDSVHLWFSFNLRDRIEAKGQIVWADAARKFGGLAFTNLSESARRQIRAQIGEIPKSEGTMASAGLNDAMSHRPSFFHANGTKLAPTAVTKATGILPRAAATSGILSFRDSARGAQESPALPGHTELVPWQQYLAATRSQFLRGVLLGILLTLVILIPIFRYALHSPLSSGRKGVSGQSAPDNPPTQPDSQGISRSNPASVIPVPSGPSRSPASAAANSGTMSNSSTSRVPPGGPARSNKSLASPDELWEQVQAGDAKAAVILADMYLHGNGVPANCAQAKILLDVAAQRHSTEAIKKSRELEKSGCPTQ